MLRIKIFTFKFKLINVTFCMFSLITLLSLSFYVLWCDSHFVTYLCISALAGLTSKTWLNPSGKTFLVASREIVEYRRKNKKIKTAITVVFIYFLLSFSISFFCSKKKKKNGAEIEECKPEMISSFRLFLLFYTIFYLIRYHKLLYESREHFLFFWREGYWCGRNSLGFAFVKLIGFEKKFHLFFFFFSLFWRKINFCRIQAVWDDMWHR